MGLTHHQVNLICISSLVTRDADQRLEQIQFCDLTELPFITVAASDIKQLNEMIL